ncbi:MAG: SurA N-terminal domain-containing protein, partial [Luteolibacter sp.]
MKLRLTACLITATSALLTLPSVAQAPTANKSGGPIEVNGIAAKVNGRVITKNQVSFMLAPVYAQLSAQYPRRGAEFEEQFKKAREGVMQELIDRRIILDEFKQLGAS